MKKTLAAAITSALVIGVASTTFAAANPFSDVPADHWSFDAVAKLAQEGVIEGYGDNTFRGDAHITRYEMAQMVAKAMAKEDVSGADKATIDKLAAEYADELNTLGVRVANLEKKSDNVIWKGLLRIDNNRTDLDGQNGDTKSAGKVRLEPKMQVNDNWAVNARIDGDTNLNGEDNSTQFKLKYGWVEGPVLNIGTKLGKFGYTDSESGLVMDGTMTGAQFTFGDAVKAKASVGRLDEGDYAAATAMGEKSYGNSDYQALELTYKTGKLGMGAAYHNVKHSSLFGDKDKNGIWAAGFDYGLTNTVNLAAAYSKSNLDVDKDDAYAVKLSYKGANSNPGSFGLWATYSEQNAAAVIDSTFDGITENEKGYEIGAAYALDKNILLKLVYADGQKIGEDKNTDFKRYWSRVDFKF